MELVDGVCWAKQFGDLQKATALTAVRDAAERPLTGFRRWGTPRDPYHKRVARHVAESARRGAPAIPRHDRVRPNKNRRMAADVVEREGTSAEPSSRATIVRRAGVSTISAIALLESVATTGVPTHSTSRRTPGTPSKSEASATSSARAIRPARTQHRPEPG
jgi:hypothetical protein